MSPTLLAGRQRNDGLDFFRGVAMLMIFIVHFPDNSWSSLVPARFGLSSGAELFVFCSGLASAMAFGGAFEQRGLLLGTARVLLRIWQIYWAGFCLAFGLIALAAAADRGFGLPALTAQFEPLLLDPTKALIGLVTLTWQPDLLDILPMYIVILALIPVMMTLGRVHSALPFFMVALLYTLAWQADLNLPGDPWTGRGWYFNPFAWQLIFFVGFFFGMKWLPVPQFNDRRVMLVAGIFVLLAVPLSYERILDNWSAAKSLRDLILSANEKNNLHLLRVFHFFALAYLTLSLIEPWRRQLNTGIGHLLILVGRQSLATFLASTVLARLGGIIADKAGRTELHVALLNLAGFAAILGVASLTAWFKRAPWIGAVRAPGDHETEPLNFASIPGLASLTGWLKRAPWTATARISDDEREHQPQHLSRVQHLFAEDTTLRAQELFPQDTNNYR